MNAPSVPNALPRAYAFLPEISQGGPGLTRSDTF